MQAEPISATENERIVAGLGFVESLARRMAASMPHSIDIGDLVQDGMLGLIDAAHRFDEARGIKFETFAERRVRGAMIDALRRDAWPRGVRRQRRELEAAREALRKELGCEPSLADLAARVGSDEKRLGRTIVRINTIESTSPLAAPEKMDESSLPAVLVPSEPDSPDAAYEKAETAEKVRAAIDALPWRERKVIALYYYGDVTMKQIGTAIGVNESRVSQLHARAIRRLRGALGEQYGEGQADAVRAALLSFTRKPRAAKAKLVAGTEAPALRSNEPGLNEHTATVVAYASATSRTMRSNSARRNGFGSQRQPLSSRNRSASVPTTSPVTKTMRRVNVGALAATCL
jgi:RNA polymerase sigma factor for flagellar operon FliA